MERCLSSCARDDVNGRSLCTVVVLLKWPRDTVRTPTFLNVIVSIQQKSPELKQLLETTQSFYNCDTSIAMILNHPLVSLVYYDQDDYNVLSCFPEESCREECSCCKTKNSRFFSYAAPVSLAFLVRRQVYPS